MKTLAIAATAVAASFLNTSCASAEDGNEGADLLQPFKAELKQALKAGLEQGPVEAIEVCRVRAPEIAKALSRDGVRMGRASHKLRNPGNAAPAWVQPVVDAYLNGGAVPEPKTVSIEDGYQGYVEPIMTQPLCLVCHGETPAPELEAKISELYPSDQAKGFSAGDLRGVFWVEYPASR